MMKSLDDLLNGYLDNDLSDEEFEYLKKIIEQDPSAERKVRALKLVERAMGDFKADAAPQIMKERIMKRIVQKGSLRKSRYPIVHLSVVIISLFLLATLIISLPSANFNIPDNLGFFSEITGKMNLGLKIKGLLDPNLIMSDATLLISFGTSLLILVSIYFILEAHKSFRRQINGG